MTGSTPASDLTARLLWVAGLLLLVIGGYALMWRAWRRRRADQSGLPPLPPVSDVADSTWTGPATAPTSAAGDAGIDRPARRQGRPHGRQRAAGHGGQAEQVIAADPVIELTGRYHGTTSAGDWLDRIIAHGLGPRTLVTLTGTPDGIVVRRDGAPSFAIPAAALRGARLDRAIAGRVFPEGGLLVITWEHGGALLDSGFRADRPSQHPRWVAAVRRLIDQATPRRDGEDHQPEGAR